MSSSQGPLLTWAGWYFPSTTWPLPLVCGGGGGLLGSPWTTRDIHFSSVFPDDSRHTGLTLGPLYCEAILGALTPSMGIVSSSIQLETHKGGASSFLVFLLASHLASLSQLTKIFVATSRSWLAFIAANPSGFCNFHLADKCCINHPLVFSHLWVKKVYRQNFLYSCS
jgi:hypothetical protein